MPQPPASFPPLPPIRPPRLGWSREVTLAHTRISGSYSTALKIIHEEDLDPARIRFHITRLMQSAFPLLDGLEAELVDEGEWIQEAVCTLTLLVIELHRIQNIREDMCVMQLLGTNLNSELIHTQREQKVHSPFPCFQDRNREAREASSDDQSTLAY